MDSGPVVIKYDRGPASNTGWDQPEHMEALAKVLLDHSDRAKGPNALSHRRWVEMELLDEQGPHVSDMETIWTSCLDHVASMTNTSHSSFLFFFFFPEKV